MWLGWVVAWSAPELGHSTEAKGRSETVFELPGFGRYAFEVKSEVGTTLRVVDRMEGPGRRVGTLGEKDGRIDGFYERGQVKVRMEAPADGRGQAVVTATPFEEIGADEALLRSRPVITGLKDKVARGWWIEVGAEPLQIEAVGRYLADLRLWRDGAWLVDATPSCGVIEPVDGQPLQRCVLTNKIEPGLYRLVAYGGPGQPWAEDAADDLLSIRWDAPELPAAGIRSARIGPTGTDVYRLPSSPTDTAHLTLPDIAHSGISLQRLNTTNLFGQRPTATITDESRTPETTARDHGTGGKVLTVSGLPGQSYEIRWFDDTSGSKTIQHSGQVLVTSVSTARPSDTLPPSAIFVRNLAQGKKVLASAAGMKLRPGTRFEKRFNLMAPTSLFVELDEPSHVVFDITEGRADVRFERVFLTTPKGYKQPKSRAQTWKDQHPAGTYKLTLLPKEPGIVTLVASPNNWSDLASTPDPLQMRPGLREVIELDRGAPLQLLHTQPPDTRTGILVRNLPLDPHQAVPLPLAPGERFVLGVKVDQATKVRATLPNGELLPLELLGTTSTEPELPRGSFALTVHNDTDKPVLTVLAAVEPPQTPARIPANKLTLPDFDRLTFSEPAFLDLDRTRRSTLQLDVAEDGLYALRSTGLLATRGQLRSRVRLNLGAGDQNGAGRNFQLDRYLRSGTYQVTVATLGKTRGHLGLELARSPMREEGALVEGRLARATAPAGEGLRYHFEVSERARATVRSAAPGQRFACRLEDDDGWPIVAPTNHCEISTPLDPGRYVLVSLPTDVETKRHTSFDLDRIEDSLEGHGPHPLALGSTGHHTWVEPPGKGERPVDRWNFTLPADLEVSIDVGEEMAGALMRDGKVLQRLAPGRVWKGPLTKGDHQLELRAARRGTGIRYGVRVSTAELTVGQSRSVNLPATLPLVVGTSGLVALSSTGDTDVRARLLDASGAVVAVNDDRPDDWNFRIGRWLEAGRWTLELSSLGSRGRTRIHVDAPAEKEAPPLSLSNKPQTVPVGETTRVHSLDAGKKANLLASFEAAQNLSVSIEQQLPNGEWSNLGSDTGKQGAFLARRVAGPVRLRIASLDGRPGEAKLLLRSIGAKAPNQAALASGVGFARTGWGAIDGKNAPAGLYRVVSDRSQLSVCRAAGRPCEPAQGVVSLDKGALLFGKDVRLELADLAYEPVPVQLNTTPTHLQTGLRGLVALEVRSVSGTAAASLANGATGLSDEGALALGRGAATVWGAGVGRIRAVELAEVRQAWDGASALALEIPAHGALTVPTFAGQRHGIALDAGLVASSGKAVLWADRGSLRGFLTAAATTTLANPTDSPALVVIEPATAPTPAVEHYASAAAVQVHRIAGSDGKLHVNGADLTYLRADGAVLRGTGFDVGAGGTAWVSHGLGWYALWEDGDGPGPWHAESAIESALVHGVNHIEAGGPFAARIDGKRVVWSPDGTPIDVLTNGGTLEIRGLGGQPVETQTRTLPVVDLTEGLGPEVLLDGSGSRWFRFELAQDGPIGFGVRASADRVTATLHGDDGLEITRGVVARTELPAGTYFLRLSQPPDAPPVRARAALTGLDRPDTGPPEDVVKTYLKNAGFVGGNP